MPIKIGINENIFIAATKYNEEKNWFTITFEENGGTKYANMFERMGAEEAVETLPTRDMMLFVPSEPKLVYKNSKNEDVKRTEEQRINIINTDMTSTKAILLHLLTGFMTAKEAALDMYQGTGIDANNYAQMMLKPEVFTKVFKNMCMEFTKKITPFFGDTSKLFRFLLLRRDAANAYPEFRKKYITENPFWEPMEIAKEASKVAFTLYELREKLDDDMPASRADADKKPGNTGGPSQPPMTASAVFGD